jgi:hypothetical protein
MNKGYIGMDFDGTISVYDGWKGPGHVGKPVPSMIALIKDFLEMGKEVRILTARVSSPTEADEARAAIEQFCLDHIGQILPVQCEKDYGMIVLFDDRAITVEPNTGKILGLTDELVKRLL